MSFIRTSSADLDTLALTVSRLERTAGARDEVRADRSGVRGGTPIAVVRATSVEDVQETLRWASATGRPVVTRGGGSALTGAASSVAGSIVLDLAALDRIVAIRPDDGVAVVEPGVITADLDRAAAEHGLLYAPDPGSVGISTIGGNIATNAGGLRGAKYGVTRDAVLALDVVLADGSLIRLGRETLKGVAGLDLVSLVVGSEGTLGVVVGATVRLLPRPVATATAVARFESLAAAADAVAAIRAARIRPAVLELLDAATLDAIDAAQGTSLAAGALLLAQTDGFGASLELEALARAVAPLASSIETTDDPVETERLLLARRSALPSIELQGPVLIEDIAVPPSRLADAVRAVGDIGRETGVPTFVFAHAGDGNVHPILLAHDLPAAEAAAARIFALALELGGTVTGEHGIGLLKRRWLAQELGPDVLELQHRVRDLFDPAGVLNPGKAL